MEKIREDLRLVSVQEFRGFPDTFKIVVSDTQAYRQFGNSVVVPLMTDVAGLIVAKLQEMEGRERK